MYKQVFINCVFLLGILITTSSAFAKEKWIDLIFENTLLGWKAYEHPDSFAIIDSVIICHGERSHLYYMGPIENHEFKNFEFKATVMTEPGSNSGIYFHTFPQEKGWPKKGYEVQINNSSPDEKRMTGSLYRIVDVLKTDVKDNEWFDIHIIVDGKKVEVYVDDEPVVHFIEPTPPSPPEDLPRRKLASGTFALQAHDPDSKVYFKDIKVKILD